MASISYVFFGIVILWLGVITVFLWNTINHYNKLSKGITDKSLRSVLENLIKNQTKNKRDLDYLKAYCDRIYKEGLFHIQKIGLIRFNPFKDTGGDQSFILSLVDGNNTGVIISGLYARSGTRWYAKKVVKGKSLEHELSEEEKTALSEAKSL
ncbi:MAG: DUF4446 family protein [Patescibacteria group bacterium]